jgi:transcription antitermination factor NusG
MDSTTPPTISLPEAPTPDEGLWYAVYTKSRQEKKVAAELSAKDVDTLLPLYASRHRWNTRLVVVRLPLFPSYLFVNIRRTDRVKVLQTFGVVDFVRFDGRPAPIPASQIEAVRRCLDADCTIKPCRFVSIGSRARIRSGPLEGVEGVVSRSKRQTRFVISVDLIQSSLRVEVDSASIEALPPTKPYGAEQPAHLQRQAAV